MLCRRFDLQKMINDYGNMVKAFMDCEGSTSSRLLGRASCVGSEDSRMNDWVQLASTHGVGTARPPITSTPEEQPQTRIERDLSISWIHMVGRARTSAEFIRVVQTAERRRDGNNPLWFKNPPNLQTLDGDPLKWLDWISYFLESTHAYEINALKTRG